jgi:hypothetical protein
MPLRRNKYIFNEFYNQRFMKENHARKASVPIRRNPKHHNWYEIGTSRNVYQSNS